MKIVVFVILILCGAVGISHGQSNTTTQGTEFWLGFMKNTATDPSENLSVFIVSEFNTTGTIEIPATGWSNTFGVVPGATTIINIPAGIAEVLTSQIIENKGIHIVSDDVVSVFAINFTTTSADATKVLPVASLGTEYIVASYSGFSPYDSEFLVVATEDDTEVEILLSAPLTGMSPGDENTPLIVQLDRGQVYQCRSASGSDLTGTVVRATQNSGGCRPFAVFSGTDCANVPSGCSYCDHIFEQNLPIQSWGTEYFMTPFQFAITGPNPTVPGYTYRIVAREDNTVVSVDGSPFATLNTGEFVEDNHQVDSRHITASQPIAVIQYMQGVDCSAIGDPSMLLLDASNQRIGSITFSTVSSTIIDQHYVNIVVPSEDVGYVTLDGTPVPVGSFYAFTGSAEYKWATLPLTEGSHHLYAPSGLNGYAYGLGDAESYAYSVGSTRVAEEVEFEDVFCTNAGVTLSIPAEYFDPVWYNAQDMNTVLHTGHTWNISAPVQTAVYTAVANANVSGCAREFHFSVESVIPPAFSIEPGNITICRYQSVQLNVIPEDENATYEYLWSPTFGLSDVTSASPVATPYSTTTYSVMVSTPTGCASATQSVTITVDEGNITNFDALSDQPSICSGESVQLNAVAQKVIWSDNFDPSVSWGDWANIANGSSGTTCGSVIGAALYFTGSGERSATTVPVDVSDGGTIHFSIKIADGVAPCDNAEPGDNVELRYSLDGISFPPANTLMVLYENAYPEFTEVTVEIPVAAQTAATYFKWMQVGAWAGNQDNWSLDEVYVAANNAGGIDYLWSPSEYVNVVNFQTPTGTPAESGYFIVEITDNLTGCVYKDSVYVEVNGNFNILLEDTFMKCNAGVMTLEAATDVSGDFDYLWNASDGTLLNVAQESPVVNPLTNTTYTVEITSGDGCSKQASMEVMVSSLNSVSLNTTDNELCVGEQTSLTAIVVSGNSDYSIAWSGPALSGNMLGATVNATPAVDSEYTIVITDDATGCQKESSIDIFVQSPPVIVLSETSITECLLGGHAISAGTSSPGAVTWEWSPVSMVTDPFSAETQLSGNDNGELQVTASTSFGCTSSASLEVNQLIEQTNLGPDQHVCEGETVLLNTGFPEEYTFNWNTGQETSAINVTTSGIYHVVITSDNGCESEDEVEITFHPAPQADLGADFVICDGDHQTIGVAPEPGLTYLWSDGQTSPSVQVSSSGVYSLIVSNDYCSDQDEVAVAVNPLPENPFSGYEREFCFLQSPYMLKLDAMNEGCVYAWNDGSTGKVFNAAEPGRYEVEITTPFGCKDVFATFIEEVCEGNIFVPNAFTPDNDGLNDVWKIEGDNISYFRLEIWNRWGELMFASDSIDRPWLGQRRDGDEYVEAGVYVYKITYAFRDPDSVIDPQYVIMGNVTLIR